MNNRKTRKRTKEKSKLLYGIIIAIGFFLVALGIFGGLGSAVKHFFSGVFGFSEYIILILAIAIIVIKNVRTLSLKPKKRVIGYCITLVVIFMLWLQIMTTYKIYDEMVKPSFVDYISQCYKSGSKASGGVVMGVFAYPFLVWIGKYSSILISILFFVGLFFALMPIFKAFPDEEKNNKKAVKANKKHHKNDANSSEQLELFVDTVIGGNKDAHTIKIRSAFNREPYVFDLFDVTDGRSLETNYNSNDFVDDLKSNNGREYEGVAFGKSDTNFAKSQMMRYEYDATSPQDLESNDAGIEIKSDTQVIEDSVTNEESSEEKNENVGNELPRFVMESGTGRRVYGESLSMEEKESLVENIKNEDITSVLVSRPVQKLESGNMSGATKHIRKKTLITDLADFEAFNQANTQTSPRSFIETEDDLKNVVESDVQSSVDFDADPTNTNSLDLAGIDQELAAMDISQDIPVTSSGVKNAFSDVESSRCSQRAPRSDIGGTHQSPQLKSKQSTFIPASNVAQMDISTIGDEPLKPYVAPPVDLLTDYPQPNDEEDVNETSSNLVKALSAFGIPTQVVDHKSGPTFTQFALTLPDGVSVSKVMSLEKDIKRKIIVEKSIRITPSVPGLDAFGVEIANKKSKIVGLRSVIDSPIFEKENAINFAMGVDVSGKPNYGTLTKMPHLIVAGATGTGKSVCLNVIISSIMMHYSPEIVRFIMIDPKRVELSMYNGMPHMLIPNALTEVAQSVNALAWLIKEMDRRLTLFQGAMCHDINEYNDKQKQIDGKKLPYIVLIIDEMADLMTRARKDAEDKISSLSSMARAAGIHLILATQRPSVDVITGTIKNNFTHRIAFRVSSFNDSRTILDKGGAEMLFGNGDMLYSSPASQEPIRLQCPLIKTEELSAILSYIKENNECRFDGEAESAILAQKEQVVIDSNEDKEDGEQTELSSDEKLIRKLLLFAIQQGTASTSMFQRKMTLSWTKAGRMLDKMEEMGYVSPADPTTNKARTVLVTMEDYNRIYGDSSIDKDGGSNV